MKVAMVSEHANPLVALGEVAAGGQNTRVAELSAALTRRGHDVTVYTRRDDAALPDVGLAPAGYRVFQLPAGPPEYVPKDALLPYLNDFAQLLTELARADRPDVLHGHFWVSGMVASLVGRALAVPVVQSFHALGTVQRRYQGEADTSQDDRIAIERAVGRAADRIIASCGDEAFELVRMGVPRYKISVIPSGVDIERFTPEGPHATRGSRPRIVSVGRLLPRKGFADLIGALPWVPDAELVIVGGPAEGRLEDDPEARRLRQLAGSLGVADRVRFAGQVARADLPAMLRSADLVACVPWYGPFSIVPLEAMACEVPVLANATGGLTDTLVDGVTGVLVPPGDPHALARALRQLLADAAGRAMLAAAGCDRARARYTWDRIALDTQRVYLSVTETPSAKPAPRSHLSAAIRPTGAPALEGRTRAGRSPGRPVPR